MEKKSFVLRVSRESFEALEKWASDEFRSVNGHLEWLIERALKESGRKQEARKHASKAKE